MHRSRVRVVVSLMLAFAGAASVSNVARADEYLTRINQPLLSVQEAKRADKVVLPLLNALEAPPAVIRNQHQAALFGAKGPGWTECADWAQKPAQKAFLDALPGLTKEEDRTKANVFAQPYGVDGVDLDLISKNLYTELGEPPLLAAARHLYMPLMERAGILVHVEASRLGAAGETQAAIKLLDDWIFFCRIMADRPFLREKHWALDALKLALERVRDVVYVELTGDKRTLDHTKILDMNKRLKERRGFMALDRIQLPEGDFIAREQLVSAIMGPDGQPSPENFGRSLARAASTERPLRLFAASAFWDSVRGDHANARETREMLKGVQNDWTQRWGFGPFDRALVSATDYRRKVATSTKFASLQLGLGDIEALFPLRQEIRTELAGTRAALGVYGFFLKNRSMPRGLSSSRPDFVEVVDKDPFSRRDFDLQFFVPERDTPTDADGNRKPHEIEIYPPEPAPKFKARLGANVFVIYSVGPDDNPGGAFAATQSKPGVSGDYLLFPPTLSLVRQRLLETNQLK